LLTHHGPPIASDITPSSPPKVTDQHFSILVNLALPHWEVETCTADQHYIAKLETLQQLDFFTMSLKEQVPMLHSVREFFGQPTVASFCAGGVAGAVSRTVVSPLERMKIIFQVQSAGPGGAPYQGVIPTLSKMWREEGWRGFMRGNGTNCIRIVPYSAVQFSSYTIYKKLLFPDQDGTTLGATTAEGVQSSFSSKFNMDALRRLTAGGLAGITSVFATYPLDIVRTRLSIQTADIGTFANRNVKPPGMWQVMCEIYRNEGGFRALYRGIIPTTMGVAPYVGLNFAVYELFRDVVTPVGQKDPSAGGKLLAGAISGAVAQTVTYPFDVLRRRFQVVAMPDPKLKEMQGNYTSVWSAIKSIIRAEGIKGMYKGLSANLLKVAPSMASSWLSYELVKDALLIK
jgi:solute carrier family 25 phosphate transporter 23/24/25/41